MILYVVMYATYKVCDVGQEVKLVVTEEETDDPGLQFMVENKLMMLEKSLLDNLNAVDSAILD